MNLQMCLYYYFFIRYHNHIIISHYEKDMDLAEQFQCKTSRMIKEVEHLLCNKRLRDLELFSLEIIRGVSLLYLNTQWEGMKKMEPNSQYCLVSLCCEGGQTLEHIANGGFEISFVSLKIFKTLKDTILGHQLQQVLLEQGNGMGDLKRSIST